MDLFFQFFNSPFFTSMLQGLSTGIGVTLGAWIVTHNTKYFEKLWIKIGEKLR